MHVPWFLCCDIGWFRQCSFIPYSRDVDFGVWIKDYDERLVQAMLDHGLTLKHRFGKVRGRRLTKSDMIMQ